LAAAARGCQNLHEAWKIKPADKQLLPVSERILQDIDLEINPQNKFEFENFQMMMFDDDLQQTTDSIVSEDELERMDTMEVHCLMRFIWESLTDKHIGSDH
jgi:hypothetical protein